MTQGHTVYKILSKLEWRQAQSCGRFEGSSIDLRDGFIHLSTAEQVPETLRLHFKDQEGLLLIAFKESSLNSLKWETSRGGQQFPHVYSTIDTAHAIQEWSLFSDQFGIPQAPW